MVGSEVRPRVLLVDDEPEKAEVALEDPARPALLEALQPGDVTLSDLKRADLVLVDFRLEKWAELASQPSLALQPSNGLALASVLQQHLRASANTLPDSRRSPTAFALFTAHLTDISDPLPPERRAHIVAQQSGLEWVFEKATGLRPWGVPEPRLQVAVLARAVQGLPAAWSADDVVDSQEKVARWLGLPPDVNWHARAYADLESCRPPMHELAERTHGLALVRWMLHRILPYPTFLWDLPRLAARLRCTKDSLIRAFEDRPEATLGEARFTGHLDGFLGPRWWRSGVESLLWSLTGGNSFDTGAVLAALRDQNGLPLARAQGRHPVQYLNERLLMADGYADYDDTVGLWPDDWPIYAEEPRTTLDLAREHPKLRALVPVADSCRLEQRA